MINQIDLFIKLSINLNLINNYAEINIKSLINTDFIDCFLELEEELERLYSEFNFYKIKVSWDGIIYFYKNPTDYAH